ncbi:hypothetical protein FE374_00575 [Georgenia yuyongxinii]|uniref:Secreted protein n=1 Tax=Georgenia yuyongxinii TaxID=2589797 RepID=A0A5B8BYF5_9MICO|nr:hypothetical protein [Georgenia yuyongxinii]QDC23324.1 hypothetical protein FE374_00575 [Georgenia yuyongxinii]
MTALPASASATSAVADALTTIAVIGGVTFLVLLTAAGLTAWVVVRKIRRSRLLRRGALRVRTVVGDQAGRELARQRVALQDAQDATERALAAAYAQHRPVGELPAVAARLADAGQELDDQLRLAEREPDRALRSALARELDGRVREHGRLSAELRASVLSTGGAVGEARLLDAGSRLAVEVGALTAWQESYGARRLG